MATLPFYSHGSLEAQLQYIIDNSETIRVTEGYDQDWTHAQVVTATVATGTCTSGDYGAIVPEATHHRRVTLNAINGSGDVDNLSPVDLWIVITKDSATAEVLAATNETTNKPIGNNDVVQFPSFYLEARQPTQAV